MKLFNQWIKTNESNTKNDKKVGSVGSIELNKHYILKKDISDAFLISEGIDGYTIPKGTEIFIEK